MEMHVNQIVKVRLADGSFVHGRVSSVDEVGDAMVRFNNQGSVLISMVLPEMVVDAFYCTGKSRFGV